MLDFIHRYMPDWAIRIIIGLALWFLICLFFVAPFIYNRITIPLRKDFVQQASTLNKHWGNRDNKTRSMEFANCLYASYFAHHEYEFTQWVATATYYTPYPIKDMEKLMNKNKYKKACGEKPWKNKRA